jgi:hypothetical protein
VGQPREAQGPGTFTVAVQVTDDGVPSLSTNQSFQITVNEVNVAPTLGSIGDQTVHAGATVTARASASDTDSPPNTLSYSLVTAPAGATLDTGTGLFRWLTTAGDADTIKTVTVRVSDNGTPVRTATTSFDVTVVAPLGIESGFVSANGVTLRWSAIVGQTYRVRYKARLDQPEWTDLPGDVTATGTTASKEDDSLDGVTERFYRIEALP